MPVSVKRKNTPPDKKRRGNISLENTESGSGERLMLLRCKAKARAKGVFLFTDTGITLYMIHVNV